MKPATAALVLLALAGLPGAGLLGLGPAGAAGHGGGARDGPDRRAPARSRTARVAGAVAARRLAQARGRTRPAGRGVGQAGHRSQRRRPADRRGQPPDRQPRPGDPRRAARPERPHGRRVQTRPARVRPPAARRRQLQGDRPRHAPGLGGRAGGPPPGPGVLGLDGAARCREDRADGAGRAAAGAPGRRPRGGGARDEGRDRARGPDSPRSTRAAT